jgi:SAM-dependent methyltransferase
LIAVTGTDFLRLEAAQVDRVFRPYVVDRFATTDPRWVAAVARAEQKSHTARKRAPRWTTPDGARMPHLVEHEYEAQWNQLSLDHQLNASKITYFDWRGEGMLAQAIGRKRVHHLLLARAIDALRPASVLEVGFGNGLNLLVLSMLFPDVAWSGVELTHAGVEAARALAFDPSTAERLAAFAVEPLRDRGAPRRLALEQGSAVALPLASKSVDMIVTVLALEQMERIRERALRELARVARRWVVMIEPFADWNGEGHRRAYIERHDYFAATVRDLAGVGLAPVAATADLPNKLAFRVGLVIATVQDPMPLIRS